MVPVVVIGAGQAGLALSASLREAGVSHVVLERGLVGARWRTERWDSLSLLTPNWMNALPGGPVLEDASGFLDRAGMIAMLCSYAADAPVVEQTTVLRVLRVGGAYEVLTDRGAWRAPCVVIATGDSDLGAVPGFATAAPGFLYQMHARRYRNPEALPRGGVLVVGAGPSGQQIAAELARAGRHVVLSVGRHARMPRTYRGRDAFFWLDAMGALDAPVSSLRSLDAARRAPNFALSGACGGSSLGLDLLSSLGVAVCGRLEGFAGRHALFADDLVANVRSADERLFRGLRSIDAFAGRAGMDAPAAEPIAPLRLGPGPSSLDLAREIRVVVWATGFRRTYPWLQVPVLDGRGELIHREGVCNAPGLFALGLRFQRTRKSHLIGGVGADAAFIASRIVESLPARSLPRAA